MTRPTVGLIVAAISLLASTAPITSQAGSAQDILARAVRAHGGDALTAWTTMVVEGTMDVPDGIIYRAAYRLWAKKPDKLRVEHDLTADGGRRFDHYFLNGSEAWMRRNLLPGKVDVARMRRWLDQCHGVARYAPHAAAFTLQGEGTVSWDPSQAPGSKPSGTVESRPVWILQATIDGVAVEISIDRERFHLVQESTPDGRRVFWDFKTFAGRTWATRINEYTRARQGETLTPYTWNVVKYDVPVEDRIFEAR